MQVKELIMRLLQVDQNLPVKALVTIPHGYNDEAGEPLPTHVEYTRINVSESTVVVTGDKTVRLDIF